MGLNKLLMFPLIREAFKDSPVAKRLNSHSRDLDLRREASRDLGLGGLELTVKYTTFI